FDRILDAFDGPFRVLPYGELPTPPEQTVPASETGYLLDARINNAFIAVNKLVATGVTVSRISEGTAGLPAGSFFIAAENASQLRLAVDSLGVGPVAVNTVPPDMHAIRPRRIALFDYYGGSMSSGWVRWLLEQYRFDNFTVVYPK